MLIDLRFNWPNGDGGTGSGCVQVLVRPPYRIPQVFTDTEELGTAGGFRLDDDFSWPSQKFEPTVYRQPFLPQPDELFFYPTPAGPMDGFQLVVGAIKRAPLVYTDTEELATLIASIALDEDAWTATSYTPTSFRQPVFDSDEDRAGMLGGLRVDEDYWVGNPYVGPSFKQPLLDSDEDHAGLGGFRLDEDYWTSSLYVGLSFRQPLLDSGDDAVSAPSSLGVDDELWVPTLYVGPNFRQPRLDSDEDHASPLGGLRVDELSWTPNLYVGPTFRQPLTDADDDHAGTLGGFRLDEDYWTPSRCDLPGFRQPILDTDENHAGLLGGLRVEVDDCPVQRSEPVSFRQPVFDDESVAPTGVASMVEDEPVLSLVSFPLVQNRQPSFEPENFVAPPSFISQGDQIVVLIKKPIPALLAVTDTDELAFAAPAFALDEEWWSKPYQQTLPSSSLVIRDTDEDHAGLLGGLRVDEDYVVHGQFRIEPNRQPSSDTDELWFQPATLSVDEETWVRPYQQLLPSSTLVIRDTDEDHAAPLGGLRVEVDDFVPGRFQLDAFRQPLHEAESQPASFNVFALEDDGALDLRARAETFFRQPILLPDEWLIAVDEVVVQQVWQPRWIWTTPLVETGQDELAWAPRDDEYWVAPPQLQWPTLRRPVWAEDEVLASVSSATAGICLSTGVAVAELVTSVLVNAIETGVAVDALSGTLLDVITTTLDSTTLTATVLPDEMGGQSLSQSC